jgi:putative Holliday junction resolvase
MLTLDKGSILSVSTSLSCSTQSTIALNCEDNSSISLSSTLIRESLAILIVVFLSIFNLYTFVTNPREFVEMLNTSETLLGLDFGDKTIGIAVSDRSLTIASPISTIKRKGFSKDFNELKDIIKEYNVGGLVFGLPLSLNGEENQRTSKVRDFIRKLSLLKKINIELYDERFSSDVIFKTMRKESQSTSKIKKKIDQQAAAYILQGFLDNANNNY